MCSLLSAKNELIYSNVLKYLGSILFSEDKRIADQVIKNDTLDKITNIMFSMNQSYLKESLWLLSNLAASGPVYIKEIIKSSVFSRILALTTSYNIDV